MVKRLKKKRININIKKALPCTPGRRHYKYITKYILTKQSTVLKSLIFKIKRSCGKSSFSGKTLSWGRQSGCKKLYRHICFFNQDTLGIVLFSVYDPNRTTFISAYFDFYSFKFTWIPALLNIYPGSIIGCKPMKRIRYYPGFRYLVHKLNNSLNFCFVSTKPNKYAQYARSAGVFCQLLKKTINFCKIRLPSNKVIIISSFCYVTFGIVSNKYHRLIKIGKAGRNILLGKKSKVRGIAMNPVDNPHGGRSNGGCCWVTPWGKPFLFKKTSKTVKKKIFKFVNLL